MIKNSTFKVYFNDNRFPEISVYNEGTIKFMVVKDGKPVDSFTQFEMAMQKEVSLTFAQEASTWFFNYLSTHPWLLRAYFHKNI